MPDRTRLIPAIGAPPLTLPAAPAGLLMEGGSARERHVTDLESSPAASGDPWETRVKALLARGAIRAARQLAGEIWHGDDFFLKLRRLHCELEDERRRAEVTEIVTAALQQIPKDGADSWPPPEHPLVSWSDLREIEQWQIRVFVSAGEGAILDVRTIARRARGRDEPNRHDKETCGALVRRGLVEKASRTGFRLIAMPQGIPEA